MNHIDSIIFDLGGVIINIRYENTIAAFSQLCGFDVSQLYTQHRQDSLFDDYETGKITSAEFRAQLRHLLSIQCSDQELDHAWNVMLLDIPRERIELLEALGKQKRIFLLSNTNEIHKTAFDRIFTDAFGDHLNELSSLFEKAYYSHWMGDRKPNLSVFQQVIDEQQLNPSRTLFIEDTAQHIAGAQEVGLQTIHLTGDKTILDLQLLGTLTP